MSVCNFGADPNENLDLVNLNVGSWALSYSNCPSLLFNLRLQIKIRPVDMSCRICFVCAAAEKDLDLVIKTIYVCMCAHVLLDLPVRHKQTEEGLTEKKVLMSSTFTVSSDTDCIDQTPITL